MLHFYTLETFFWVLPRVTAHNNSTQANKFENGKEGKKKVLKKNLDKATMIPQSYAPCLDSQSIKSCNFLTAWGGGRYSNASRYYYFFLFLFIFFLLKKLFQKCITISGKMYSPK